MRCREKNGCCMPRHIKGASMVEYIIGLMAIVIALTVLPVPYAGGLTAIDLFTLALKDDYSAYSDSLSRPR